MKNKNFYSEIWVYRVYDQNIEITEVVFTGLQSLDLNMGYTYIYVEEIISLF